MSAYSSSIPKDKKPFTYLPGGIDFSQLKSPKMAKRIAKHQEDIPPTVPAPSSSSTNTMENPAPVRNQRSGSWSGVPPPGAFNSTNTPLSGAIAAKPLKQAQPVRRSISDLMATSNYDSSPQPPTLSSTNHEMFNYNPYAPSRPMSLSPPVARSNSLPPTAEFQPTPIKSILKKPQPPKQGLPPPHPQQGLPPSNYQQGLSSTYHQQGLPPPHPQQGLPPANYQQGLPPTHHQQGLPPPHPLQGLPPHSQQGMTLSQPQQGLPPYHSGGSHPSHTNSVQINKPNQNNDIGHQIKASKDLIIEPSLNNINVSQSYPVVNHVYQNSEKYLIPESVQSLNEISKKETLSSQLSPPATLKSDICNNLPSPTKQHPPTLMHEALIPPPPPPPPPPMNLGVVAQYGKSGVPYIGPKPVKSSMSLSSIRAGNTNFQEQEEEAKKQEQLMMQRIMEEQQQAERQQREEEERKQKQLMIQQLEQQKRIEAQQQAERQQREEEERKQKQIEMQQLEQQKRIEEQQQAERQRREEEEKKQKQIVMQQLEQQKMIEAQQQVEFQQKEEAKKQRQFTMQQLEQQKILEALKEAEQREEEARKQKQFLMQQLERQKSLDDHQYLERQKREEEEMKQQQLMMKQLECQRFIEEQQQEEHQQREEEERNQKQLMMQQLEQQKIIEAQQQAERQQREEEERKQKQLIMQQLEQQKLIEAQQKAERQQREEEERKQKQLMMQQLEQQKIIEAQQQAEHQQREEEERKQKQLMMQQLEQQKLIEAQQKAEQKQREEEERKQKQLMMQQLEQQKIVEAQQQAERQLREEEVKKQNQLLMQQAEQQKMIEMQQHVERQQREEKKQKELMMQQLEHQKIMKEQQQLEHQQKLQQQQLNGFDHSLNEFEAQRNLMLTPPVTRDGDIKRSKSKELQIPSSNDKSVTRGFEKPPLTSDTINNTMPPLHTSHPNSKSKTESNKVKNFGNTLKNLVMPSRNDDDELRLIERNRLKTKEENLSDPNLHQSVRLRPPSPGIVSKIQFNKMGSKPSSKFAKTKENEYSDNIGFDNQEYLHNRNTQMGNKQNGGFSNGNHNSESISSTDTKINSNGKLKTIDRLNCMESEDEIAGKIITGKMKLIEAQMKRDLEAKSVAPVNINIESGMSSKRSSFRSESTEPICSKISGDGSFSEGELSTDETGIKLPIKMAPYEVMEEFEDAPEEFYLGISAYNIEHPIDKDDTVPAPEKSNNTQIIELEGPFESEPLLNTPQSHSPVNISIRKNVPNDLPNKRQGSESMAFENLRNMSNFSTPVQQKSSYQPFENKNTITDHFESMPSMFHQEPFMTPLTLDQLDCSFPNNFSSPFSMLSPSFNMEAHNRLNNMIPVIEKNSNNGSNVAHRNENRGERSIPIQVVNSQRHEKSGNYNSVEKTQFSPPPAFNKTPNSQPRDVTPIVDRNNFPQTGAANISSSEKFVPAPPPPPQPKMSLPVSRQAEMMPPQMSGQTPKITPAMLQSQIVSKKGQKDKGTHEISSNNSSQTSIPVSHFSRQNSVKSPIDFQSSKTDADYRKNALNAIVGEISSHNSVQPSKVGGLRRGPNQSPSMRLLGRLHSVSSEDQE